MTTNLAYRKKRWIPAVNRKMLWLLLLFFIFLLVVIFLQSPIGRIGTLEIKGISLLEEEEVLEHTGLRMNTPLIKLLVSQPEKALLDLPEVKHAQIHWQLPNGVQVLVVEYRPVATWVSERGPALLLENGQPLHVSSWELEYHELPKVILGEESQRLSHLAGELAKLPASLLTRIQEIALDDPEKQEVMRLSMRDGFEVMIPLSDFSQKLNAYPAIARYLQNEGLTSGIVHIKDVMWYEPLPVKEEPDAETGEPPTRDGEEGT